MGDAIAQRSLVKEGKYDMVKWWQWHGIDAPKLAALAIRTLSQAVSASPCERGWSTWDGVHTARRNRLGSTKCRDLVFVAHNWNVVRNWHSRADVMPGVVLGNMPEPPMPEGYNVVEGDEEEEEEGDDDREGKDEEKKEGGDDEEVEEEEEEEEIGEDDYAQNFGFDDDDEYLDEDDGADEGPVF
ncbi:unnamed protein product [Closterium sp. NIES-54]